MTKLGTRQHIHDVYFRGRDYIIEEEVKRNLKVGLSLLKGYIVANWDLIMEIMEEENGRE